MTLALYPLAVRGMRWPSMKTHEFGTEVQQAPNFYTTRIINSQNPIWHFTLWYEYLKDNPNDLVASLAPHTDYRYLEGFLLSNQGQFAEFLYNDLDDNSFGGRSRAAGPSSSPSIFQVSIYPTQEFYYPLGSYVVDNNATPHLQLVIQGGVGGSTVPTFSTSGGITTSGSAKFSDQGVFTGANAQILSLVDDTTNPVSAAAVASGGTGFTVGDYLSVAGGGGGGATISVASESGGVITGFSIVSGGSGYTTTSGAALEVLTGSGTGSPTADITATTLYYTPIQRNFGGQFLEDVTDLNTSIYPLTIWANGAQQTGGSDYTVEGPGLAIPGYSFQGLYLKWAAQPTGPITGLGQFYFRTCMESDQQDIEEFLAGLWTIGGTEGKNGSGMLKIKSSRVALV